MKLTAILLFVSMGMSAQNTTVATQLGVGGANTLDTYLTPEKYCGAEWRLQSEVRRDSRKHDNVTYALTHETAFAYTHNRHGNGHQYSGHYDFSYAVMRRWTLMEEKLTLYAGGMVDALVGGAYNSRNSSNNPAQGYGTLAVGANLAARYSFTLFGKSVVVGYEARYPMLGMMFSPNYGQSYYEIFNCGDYDHNIVCTSMGTFQLRQQLNIDVPVKNNISMRLGYLSDIRQATPNNLKQHHYYNGVVLGIIVRKK